MPRRHLAPGFAAVALAGQVWYLTAPARRGLWREAEYATCSGLDRLVEAKRFEEVSRFGSAVEQRFCKQIFSFNTAQRGEHVRQVILYLQAFL
jgi:hypothetical protein